MIKQTFGYILGIIIMSTVLGYVLSLALSILPYLGVAAAVVLPMYGLVRQKKQWVSEHAGIGKWIKSLATHFKLATPSITFYLILGLALGFIYEDVALLFAKTVGHALGGAIFTMVLWNSIGTVLRKGMNVNIPTYQKALRDSW